MTSQPSISRGAWVFFLGLSCVAAVFYALLWAWDLGRLSQVPWSLWSSPAAAGALSNLAEITVGVLAVAVTVVSIIVELASNRYTPRITEVFLRDRVNITVLSFFVLTAVMVLWISLSLGDSPERLPRAMVLTAAVMLSVSLLALLPYFAYVFEFLSPTHLVGRIGREAATVLERVADGGVPVPAAQAEVILKIDQLGDVALKSVQNQDKAIAIAATAAITEVLSAQGRLAARLPLAWYDADTRLRNDADFVAFHPDVIAGLQGARTWLWMKGVLQLQSVYLESVHRMRDISHLVGASTRRLGVEAAVAGDAPSMVLAQRFLHTFLRTAINASDVRTAYNLINEYRAFAAGVLATPCQPMVVGMAERMKDYGQVAFRGRLPFILETVAYDLCELLEQAHARGAPEFEALLQVFLDVDREADGGSVQEAGLRGVRKAQIKLGTWLLCRGEQAAAARVQADLRREDGARLRSIRDELERTTERTWWEINDRGVNFDWLDDERRAMLSAFFDGLEGRA